ncbi:MAG: hypothetical protein JW764_02270 [Chlorobiaceae bacterium]|nr:hypothetical protein [Chlorobiaceae bacterium]
MFRTLAKALLLTAVFGGVQTLLTLEPVVASGQSGSKAHAGKPAAFDTLSMIGSWSGQVETGSGNQIPVRMLIRPVGDDRLALKMIYGGERLCMLDGAFEGEANGTCRFRLKSQGGSACDQLAQLTLKMKSANSIAYTVSGVNGQVVESGVVSR